MTLLLATVIPRTLTQLVERFTANPVTRIEAWLFEDEAARRAAERALAAVGVQATLRSAYKPLVHFFLEELGDAGAGRIEIRTPAGHGQRFRLEAYPLAGMLGVDRVEFVEGEDPSLHCTVVVAGQRFRVFAPNDATMSPCGWLRIWEGDTLTEDAALKTEFEAAADAALDAVRRHAWPTTLPLFDTLEIAIRTPGIERPLPFAQEVISTADGLHEDCYLGALEFFKTRAGLSPDSRTLQLGQIVAEIATGEGDAQVVVRLAAHERIDRPVDPSLRPETATRPLTPVEVERAVAELPGEPFSVTSFQGRKVAGVHRRGSLPGLVVTAGQHANETSGIVGALRAARVLNDEHPQAHFAFVPLENPDGAALHHRLQATHPTHILHAARYTALGDDLEYRTEAPFGEKAARLEALERTQARLHLSLHGYPAHEWTRPRTGYVPRASELWMIPKGFFLILRRHPGHDGMPFLHALTKALSAFPDLVAFNAGQQRMWHAHVGEMPFELINGFPCMVTTDERSSAPFMLVTEFPDQTLHGAAFQLAHTAQMRTVVAAARLYWDGLLD